MSFTPVRATLREIRMRLKEPFRISSGVTHERRVLLVALEDGEGHVGWGECVAGELPNYAPETVDTCRLALTQWLLPRALGTSLAHAADIAAAWERDVRGHRMAKAAIEMAAWALEAERNGVSVARLLNGSRASVPVGISLGLTDGIESHVARAKAAQAQGYRRIKLKIAPGRDVTLVAAAREALGPDQALSVDANAAYSPRDTDHLRGLDTYGLAMIEQPFAGDDLLKHAQLQAVLTTPICLDESIPHAAACADAAVLGSCCIINIKPGRVGGHAEARRIHDRAAEAGIPVWCGGMLETGIGRAHNVALASLPNFTLPSDLSPSARYWEEDIVDPPWTMSADGLMTVPHERPGLGVTVLMDRVEDRTVWLETIEN